jgi:hypothetical protein
MKRPLALVAAAVFGLTVLAGVAAAQKAKKPDVVGTWVGYAITPDQRIEVIIVIDKGETGYAGKLKDATGMIPETPLREIVFKEGKLSFAFDFSDGMETQPIRIELTLENETLKGAWFDSGGNSDIVELTLKK